MPMYLLGRKLFHQETGEKIDKTSNHNHNSRARRFHQILRAPVPFAISILKLLGLGSLGPWTHRRQGSLQRLCRRGFRSR